MTSWDAANAVAFGAGAFRRIRRKRFRVQQWLTAGKSPAPEYIIRSKFNRVVTLPTDDRVVGDPRCCCSATGGPSIYMG